MRFAFSEEQEELRRGARRFLESHASPRHVRAAMESERGHDDGAWTRIAGMGWPALGIPEAYGGAGFGPVELAAVQEELGRSLCCVPFLSSACLAASALVEGGTEEQKVTHLPGIADGTTRATLAWMEPGGRAAGDGERVETVARRDGDGFTLAGEKAFVLDGHTAQLLVVAARTGAGPFELFLVSHDAPGLTRRQLPTMDRTRRVATLQLDGVRVPGAARLGEPGSGPKVLARTLDLAAVALAAEQVGGAARCLEMAVEYAKLRVQFSRAIGSFQAIKHRLADMFLEVESARSAAYYAAWAAQVGDPELPALAAACKAYCSEAYFHAAAENVQVHGGIGFTWEHDAHLHFKRARASEQLLGDPSWHRERVAQWIGL